MALFYYFKDLPSLSDLEAKNGHQIVQINYANGSRLTNRVDIDMPNTAEETEPCLAYGVPRKTGRDSCRVKNKNIPTGYSEVSYYELPPQLINAVIATEDRRFFSHHGVDFFGILRASYANHEAGKIVQGGSTITQQLAKLLFLNSEKTVKRKIQEILLALQLERNFTKEQILTFYLNRAYFGSGSYGIGNAAKHYFGKDVSRLNLDEAALLAGLLKAPSKFSPQNNRQLAKNRAEVVLKNMIAAGFLDKKNLQQLNHAPSYKIDHSQRLYFADFVYEQFGEFLDKKSAREKLLKITSSLDEEIQEKLENILDEFSEKNSKKIGKSQLAVLVMKKTGAVLGMSGGKDYQQSQFNRAVYAKRQAGSAFKTFVYLAAFENGFGPEDLFEDKKINVGAWLPENYNSRYLGEVTLQQAFANSLNSVAVQLGKKLGGEAVVSEARKCGILSAIDKNDPTIALGTVEVSLLELTAAYATIANGGEAVIPYAISEIRNSADELLYRRESSGLGMVISEEAEENIKKVLRAVVVSGTGKNANAAANIHGKTGTSQNFRDAWFIGFNDDYVVGVWIGNDDNSATDKITGGSLPASLFAEVITKI